MPIIRTWALPDNEVNASPGGFIGVDRRGGTQPPGDGFGEPVRWNGQVEAAPGPPSVMNAGWLVFIRDNTARVSTVRNAEQDGTVAAIIPGALILLRHHTDPNSWWEYRALSAPVVAGDGTGSTFDTEFIAQGSAAFLMGSVVDIQVAPNG